MHTLRILLVTFRLRKRVLRQQDNKAFHTYFSIDNVCNNIYEISENNSEKTFFFSSFGF